MSSITVSFIPFLLILLIINLISPRMLASRAPPGVNVSPSMVSSSMSSNSFPSLFPTTGATTPVVSDPSNPDTWPPWPPSASMGAKFSTASYQTFVQHQTQFKKNQLYLIQVAYQRWIKMQQESATQLQQLQQMQIQAEQQFLPLSVVNSLSSQTVSLSNNPVA